MVRGLALGVALAVLQVGSAGAQDAGKRVTLRWDAPDSCPDDAQVLSAVEGFLGQRLAESREQELSVSVRVQGAAGGFSAKVTFASPQGNQQRFLEHPECAKLMEAAALLAALAIDPERVRARQEANANPIASAEPVPVPAPTPLTPPPAPQAEAPPSVPCRAEKPAPRPPEPALRANLSVLGFAGIGTLPGLAPGVAAEAGVRWDRLRATLVGRYWLTATAELADANASRVELSLATAGLRACALPLASEWVLLGCLGADLGDMAGSGQGVDNARTRHDLFAALEASFSAAYVRSELKPLLGLGLSLPLRRPPFGVLQDGDGREAFRPSRVGLIALLGLAYGL